MARKAETFAPTAAKLEAMGAKFSFFAMDATDPDCPFTPCRLWRCASPTHLRARARARPCSSGVCHVTPLPPSSAVKTAFGKAQAELGLVNVLVYNAGGDGFGQTARPPNPQFACLHVRFVGDGPNGHLSWHDLREPSGAKSYGKGKLHDFAAGGRHWQVLEIDPTAFVKSFGAAAQKESSPLAQT